MVSKCPTNKQVGNLNFVIKISPASEDHCQVDDRLAIFSHSCIQIQTAIIRPCKEARKSCPVCERRPRAPVKLEQRPGAVMDHAVSKNKRQGNVENVNRSFHLRAPTERSGKSENCVEAQHVILGADPCPGLRACKSPVYLCKEMGCCLVMLFI